ncbi:MAG TPA: aminotransferase class IV [Candidatus Eisenbacteria bacterium]|nr:aminotransferase class IV [Candidatus Eisenbacteria bacterium]
MDVRRRAPKALDRMVWIDGEIRRGEDAVLSVFDRGARDGEGLFETVRIYDGQPFQWKRHLERLVVSAAELRFPVPPSPRVLRDGLAELLRRAGLTDAAARITVTRGIPGGGGKRTRTGSWIEAENLAARLWRAHRSGARLVYSRRPFEPGPLGRHKTTSRLAYHLAREEARAARADEALLVSASGAVLEGSVSTLFVVDRGVVRTPPLALGILPGIARATVLELCAELGLVAEESRLTPRDLDRADEIFLTNSIQEVVPVAVLEGRSAPLGDEVVARIRAAYSAAVAREIERGALPPTVA